MVFGALQPRAQSMPCRDPRVYNVSSSLIDYCLDSTCDGLRGRALPANARADSWRCHLVTALWDFAGASWHQAPAHRLDHSWRGPDKDGTALLTWVC